MKSYLDALSSTDPVDHQKVLRSAKADGGLEALLNLFSISQNGTFEGPIPWNDELAQNIVPRYSLSQSNLTLDGQHKFKDTSWLTYFKNLTTIDITGDFSDVTIDLNEVNKNSKVKIKNIDIDDAEIGRLRGLFSDEIEAISLHKVCIYDLEQPKSRWGKNLKSLYWAVCGTALNFYRFSSENQLDYLSLDDCPIPKNYSKLLKTGFLSLQVDAEQLAALVKKLRLNKKRKFNLDDLSLIGSTDLIHVHQLVKLFRPKELYLHGGDYGQLADGSWKVQEFMKLLPDPPCKIVFPSYHLGSGFFPEGSGYVSG